MANSRRALADDAPTDEDLGIGETDDAPQALSNEQFLLLLQDPRLAHVIDAAVSARLGQMQGEAQPQAAGAGVVEIVAAIERLTELHQTQLPGYSKPVPAAELERRADGYVEMNALIERYQELAQSDPYQKPRYKLLEPLFVGEILYEAPSIIATFHYPNEHMEPQNESAQRISAAMYKWIGGKQPDIGSRLAEAEAASRRPTDGSPFLAPRTGVGSDVEILEGPPDTRASLGRPKALSEMPVHQV